MGKFINGAGPQAPGPGAASPSQAGEGRTKYPTPPHPPHPTPARFEWARFEWAPKVEMSVQLAARRRKLHLPHFPMNWARPNRPRPNWARPNWARPNWQGPMAYNGLHVRSLGVPEKKSGLFYCCARVAGFDQFPRKLEALHRNNFLSAPSEFIWS